MIIKDIQYEDFINYKLPSMFIIFPYCTFKCDKENGCQYCHNMPLIYEPDIDIPCNEIVNSYINNPITSAIVCGGLEPMDSFDDVLALLSELRRYSDDDFVIYTGYNREEILDKIVILSQYKNVIIKFGRYRNGNTPHLDEVLGIRLASDNQYAERIS